MRMKILASAMLMGAAAFCSPAFADDSVIGPNDEIIPVVAPGDQIGVACGALKVAQQNSDVRVVLTVSAMPGNSDNPGYGKVLATEQKVALGAVRVTVPDLPDISDHTYDLTIYVVGTKGSQSCDAGHVKVAQHRLLEQPSGQHS
jgi:hypothetical protein